MADPYVLVISASNPNYSNLEEFVEYAKANPGVVKMADSGVGAAPNVAAKAFEKYFDISFDFYTYDGAPECVTAVETAAHARYRLCQGRYPVYDRCPQR